LSNVLRGELSVAEGLARIFRLREPIDQQVATIDLALKPEPMHCLMKLARARHLIEVFALSSATLNRSFYQRLKSTLFEHNTIAVDGRVLKLSVSQQYQPASFGDRVRKFLLLARSVSEKNRHAGD